MALGGCHFRCRALRRQELYEVFFRLRLDHPEIFWATGYKYRYYPESANLDVPVPEYLFDKRQDPGAPEGDVGAEWKNWRGRRRDLSEWEKGEIYVHDFICENVHLR